MPRKFKPRKSKTKRKRRGRKSSNRTVGSVPQSISYISPLPMKFKARLRYSDPYDSFTILALNQQVGKVYTANGLYDPDITRVGHQPSGFDQLMLMYDHYVVIGCKITVTFYNQGTTTALLCTLSIKDSDVLEGDARIGLESGKIVSCVIGNINTTSLQTLTMAVNPAKFLGRTKPLNDPTLKGTSAANPTEGAYFHVQASSIDGLSGTVVRYTTMLEYTAIFFEPKPVGLS